MDGIPHVSPEAGKSWRRLGPGGGGALYTPTICPHDPDTVFVTCDMTGTYLTRNGGISWDELNFQCRILSIAFDLHAKGVVYVGGTGLYRSEDMGRSWDLIFPNPLSGIEIRTIGDHAELSFRSGDNWPDGMVQAIVIDPDNPDCLFIGIRTGQGATVFSSSDKGRSWHGIGSFPGREFRKIVAGPISPGNNRSLLVITDASMTLTDSSGTFMKEIPLPGGAGMILQATCGADPKSGMPVIYMTTPSRWEGSVYHTGVYVSVNWGMDFAETEVGLREGLRQGEARIFTSIAACEKDGGTVYVTVLEPTADTGMNTDLFGVFKSDDKGNSWKWVLRIGKTYPANKQTGWLEQDFRTDWCGAPINLGVSPVNPDICHATDWGTAYRTLNGGRTWEQAYCDMRADGTSSTRGIDITNVYGVHFDPFDDRHLVLSCTDIGLLQSLSGGEGWSHAQSGIPEEWVNTCYWMIFDPAVKGKAWSVWSGCHDMPRPKMFRDHFQKYQGGICRTEDGLKTWRKSSDGLPDNCVPTHIILDPGSEAANRTLYLAVMGKGVYKSADDGKSWTLKNNGITGNLNAWKLVLTPNGTLFLLVARGLESGKAVDGALYKSVDNAESWTTMSLPDGVGFPNHLCFDSNEPDVMVLACWPSPANGKEKGGGAFLTEDGGIRWRLIFPDSSHVYGAVVPSGQPYSIILTTFEGEIMRSDDRGVSWRQLPGYDFKWAKEPFCDPHHEGMLYVTTFGSSVWHGPDGHI
jgi:photosystem II stability/assembly factor-like uncharacterized protein